MTALRITPEAAGLRELPGPSVLHEPSQSGVRGKAGDVRAGSREKPFASYLRDSQGEPSTKREPGTQAEGNETGEKPRLQRHDSKRTPEQPRKKKPENDEVAPAEAREKPETGSATDTPLPEDSTTNRPVPGAGNAEQGSVLVRRQDDTSVRVGKPVENFRMSGVSPLDTHLAQVSFLGNVADGEQAAHAEEQASSDRGSSKAPNPEGGQARSSSSADSPAGKAEIQDSPTTSRLLRSLLARERDHSQMEVKDEVYQITKYKKGTYGSEIVASDTFASQKLSTAAPPPLSQDSASGNTNGPQVEGAQSQKNGGQPSIVIANPASGSQRPEPLLTAASFSLQAKPVESEASKANVNRKTPSGKFSTGNPQPEESGQGEKSPPGVQVVIPAGERPQRVPSQAEHPDHPEAVKTPRTLPGEGKPAKRPIEFGKQNSAARLPPHGEPQRAIEFQGLSNRSGLGDGSGSAKQQGTRDAHDSPEGKPAQFQVRGGLATTSPATLADSKPVVDGARPVTAEGRASSMATELPESVERVVQAASMQKKADSNQMHVLLRDSHLGRLALRLVERAGLIDTLVRTDSTRTRALVSESLPSLFETLTQRGLQVSHGSQQGWGGAYQEPPGQRGGQQRNPRAPFRAGQNRGKAGREFRVQVEQIQ